MSPPRTAIAVPPEHAAFGSLLRTLREAQGLRAADVAVRAAVSRFSVLAVERGCLGVDLHRADRRTKLGAWVCNGYGLTPAAVDALLDRLVAAAPIGVRYADAVNEAGGAAPRERGKRPVTLTVVP